MAATSPDLARRYEAAARDAASEVVSHGGATADRHARMRAAVDAIWTHLSPVGVSWVGFYFPHLDSTGAECLVLGPSQNKPACSPIGLYGVCGQSYRGRCVRIVRDVHELGSEYVACDPRDRSEIVLPVDFDGRTVAVLDLDSPDVGHFTEEDAEGLRLILKAVGLTPGA